MDPFSLLFAILALAAVTALAYKTITSWIDDNKTDVSSYATLVKERLDNGNYKVVSGIFDDSGELEVGNGWEAEELDDELEREFNEAETVYINL